MEDATGTPAGPPSGINSDLLAGAHLLCFSVTIAEPALPPPVLIGNQFTTTPLGGPGVPAAVTAQVVAPPNELCLPSTKTPNNGNGTPEVSSAVLLPLAAAGVIGGAWIVSRRRRTNGDALVA